MYVKSKLKSPSINLFRFPRANGKNKLLPEKNDLKLFIDS